MPSLGNETNSCARVGQDRTVIVVGSGLAGLATAVGLARLLKESESPAGHDGNEDAGSMARTVIEVVEKRPMYTVRGAAFGLAPNGLKALRELCPEVAQTLVDEGILMPTGGYLLPWFRVREALLNYAQALPGNGSAQIRFHMGWTLDRFEHVEDPGAPGESKEGQAVRAFFTNGEVLEGSILIAADGIHSKVRELLDLSPALQPPASRIWRGHVQVPEDSVLYKHISKGGVMPLGSMVRGQTLAVIFSFHEKTPGAVAWTVTTKEPDIDRNTSVVHALGSGVEPSSDDDGASSSSRDPESKEELFRELLRLTSEADLTSVYDNTVVQVPDEDGSGWGGTGLVVLVGDSAHAMRPASGLGGSMAFEDAQLLCRKLTPWILRESETSLWGSQALPDVLREFENERLVRVRRIWHMEWHISESAYKKLDDPSAVPDDDYKAWLFAGI